MKYELMKKEEFDAVVTGELTHYATWFEGELDSIITDYFCDDSDKKSDFRRLILQRDGLTAQDKIEIVRAMLPLFVITKIQEKTIKSILQNIEEFKSWRNAMAHGLDVTGENYNQTLKIRIVNRAGKEKVIEITPKSHRTKLHEAGLLYTELVKAKKELFISLNIDKQ